MDRSASYFFLFVALPFAAPLDRPRPAALRARPDPPLALPVELRRVLLPPPVLALLRALDPERLLEPERVLDPERALDAVPRPAERDDTPPRPAAPDCLRPPAVLRLPAVPLPDPRPLLDPFLRAPALPPDPRRVDAPLPVRLPLASDPRATSLLKLLFCPRAVESWTRSARLLSSNRLNHSSHEIFCSDRAPE
jgi:hypothetical protein